MSSVGEAEVRIGSVGSTLVGIDNFSLVPEPSCFALVLTRMLLSADNASAPGAMSRPTAMYLFRKHLSQCLILALLCPLAYGGKYNRDLDIGQVAPAWKALPGVDGKMHALGRLGEEGSCRGGIHLQQLPLRERLRGSNHRAFEGLDG